MYSFFRKGKRKGPPNVSSLLRVPVLEHLSTTGSTRDPFVGEYKIASSRQHLLQPWLFHRLPPPACLLRVTQIFRHFCGWSVILVKFRIVILWVNAQYSSSNALLQRVDIFVVLKFETSIPVLHCPHTPIYFYSFIDLSFPNHI